MRHIDEQDKILIKKFDEIRQKGYYANSNQVTALYNKILEKNVKNTTCGSCLRGRIQELVNALKKQEQAEIKAQEALKNDEPNNSPSEAKEAVTEAEKEEINDDTTTQRATKKRQASKPKANR